MDKQFSIMLLSDGHKNSLGRVNEVIALTLDKPERLEELYQTMFDDDAWVRMRAADAFEKICRTHPDWIKPYIDRLQRDLSKSTQASIQWHLAQIYAEVELTKPQKMRSIRWLKEMLDTTDVDWIVAANSMKTLAYFTRNGDVDRSELFALLRVQLEHKSNAVKRVAARLLAE